MNGFDNWTVNGKNKLRFRASTFELPNGASACCSHEGEEGNVEFARAQVESKEVKEPHSISMTSQTHGQEKEEGENTREKMNKRQESFPEAGCQRLIENGNNTVWLL